MDPAWSTSASQGMRQVLISEGRQDERYAFLVAQRKADADAPTPTTVTAMRAGKGRKPEPLLSASSCCNGLLTETFSESFSKWVRNCSSRQCESTLNFLEFVREIA